MLLPYMCQQQTYLSNTTYMLHFLINQHASMGVWQYICQMELCHKPCDQEHCFQIPDDGNMTMMMMTTAL